MERVAAGDPAGARSAWTRDAELSSLAEREFQAALDSWPDNEYFQGMFAKHMVRRIDALDTFGDHGAALEVARKLVRTLPALPAAQARLGAMYARAGRQALAREILERAIAEHPDNDLARVELRRLFSPFPPSGLSSEPVKAGKPRVSHPASEDGSAQ
jgi:tetratricopeptide (TPR) repeat protein